MKINKVLAALVLGGVFGISSQAIGSEERGVPVSTASEQLAYLSGKLKAQYPTTRFNEINSTPIEGIYELVTGKNVFYTDKEGAYLIFGSMFDMANGVDLTADRKDQLNRLEFSELDVENAIIEVKGDGSRKVAVLTDVDCPYCKRLEETLKNVTDVTIYRYLFPIDSLHPNARSVSEAIWCLENNEQRLTAFMNYIERGMSPAGELGCETPISEIQQFAENYELRGTPTLIGGSGRIVPGAVPLETLEVLLNESVGIESANIVVSQGQ